MTCNVMHLGRHQSIDKSTKYVHRRVLFIHVPIRTRNVKICQETRKLEPKIVARFYDPWCPMCRNVM